MLVGPPAIYAILVVMAWTAGCLRPRFGWIVLLVLAASGPILFYIADLGPVDGLVGVSAMYASVGMVAEWLLGYGLVERRPFQVRLMVRCQRAIVRVWRCIQWRRIGIAAASVLTVVGVGGSAYYFWPTSMPGDLQLLQGEWTDGASVVSITPKTINLRPCRVIDSGPDWYVIKIDEVDVEQRFIGDTYVPTTYYKPHYTMARINVQPNGDIEYRGKSLRRGNKPTMKAEAQSKALPLSEIFKDGETDDAPNPSAEDGGRDRFGGILLDSPKVPLQRFLESRKPTR